MFNVCAAADQRYFNISQRGTDQNAFGTGLLQTGNNLMLPVFIQHVDTALAGIAHPRSPLGRFQQEMGFGIVPQWLKVADSLNWRGDGLAIQNAALDEVDVYIKSF